MEKNHGRVWRQAAACEGLEALVRKAIVNAFVEVKWRLSR